MSDHLYHTASVHFHGNANREMILWLPWVF